MRIVPPELRRGDAAEEAAARDLQRLDSAARIGGFDFGLGEMSLGALKGWSRYDREAGSALVARWEATGHLTGEDWARVTALRHRYRRQLDGAEGTTVGGEGPDHERPPPEGAAGGPGGLRDRPGDDPEPAAEGLPGERPGDAGVGGDAPGGAPAAPPAGGEGPGGAPEVDDWGLPSLADIRAGVQSQAVLADLDPVLALAGLPTDARDPASWDHARVSRVVRAVRQIERDEEAELAPYRSELALLQAAVAGICDRYRKARLRLEFALERWADTHEPPRGAKSHLFPCGRVGRRKNPPRVDVVDEAQAVAWARRAGFDAAVRETVLVSKIKEHLLATGEQAPGVVVHPGEDTFYVKTTAATGAVEEE